MAAQEISISQDLKDRWAREDEYHNSFLLPQDDTLTAVLKNSVDQGLPNIAVSPAQGKFLNLLAKSIGARRFLEIGTLGGYSSVWVARALIPGGGIVSFERSELHAKVARENFKMAGVADKIKVIVGPAAESLANYHPEEPFDFAFIDADTPSDLIYFTEAKRLVRQGGVIIVDNMIRRGLVGDESYTDASVVGIRALLNAIKNDDEVEATTIATVGVKGYDGFLYAIRK